MTPEILGIIGVIVTMLLGLNAHFVKALVDSINDVKIQTATLVANSEENSRRLHSVEEEIELVRDRYHDLVNKTNAQFLGIEVKLAELRGK